MSGDDRDWDDGLAEAFAAIFAATLSFAIGAMLTAYVQWKNTVRLPNKLELPDNAEPELPFSQRLKRFGQQLINLLKSFKNWKLRQTPFLYVWIASSIAYVGISVLLAIHMEIDGALVLWSFCLLMYLCLVITIEISIAHRDEFFSPPESEPITVEPLNLSTARAYTIYLPRSAEWEPERAYRFIEQILNRFKRLTFQIIAEKHQIRWRIVDLRRDDEPSLIMKAIQTAYPEAEISVTPLEVKTFSTPLYRFVLRFKQAAEFVGPIQYVTDIKDFDPLVSMTQEMSDLEDGEQIIYTLFVAGLATFAKREGEKLITTPNFHPLQFTSNAGWYDYSLKSAQERQMKDKYPAPDQKVFVEKLNNPIYQCLLLVEATTSKPERIRSLLLGFDASIRHLANPPYNAVVWHTEGKKLEEVHALEDPDDIWKRSALGLLDAWLTDERKDWKDIRLLIEPREMAGLWHLPHKQFSSVREIIWGTGSRVPVPAAILSNVTGVLLGENHYAGKKVNIYLPDEDRDTHLNIVGKTKVGKSTLIHHMVHEDIKAGHGVAVIDPHGTLVSQILRHSIPDGRVNDVIVLDVANEQYPAPLNPLLIPGGITYQIAAGRFMSVLEKIYGGFGDKTRTTNTLTAALITLWQQETSTIRDINRLFEDVTYRDALLASLENIEAEEYWEKFERQSQGYQDQVTEPVVNRIRPFYSNQHLYPMLCHPDALPFSKFMDEQKIILVSLKADEDKISPREQQLLGAVLVSLLQMAAMKSAEDKPPFYLYIDEAQDFVTTSLSDMFSEARKFGLRLIVANQFLRQLAGDTLDSIMGNVGATIAFQVGPDDARTLASYLKPEFSAEDLMNLDLHKAAIKMRYHGQSQPAFSLESPKPIRFDAKDEGRSRESYLRQRSMECYTPKPREEVMSWLRARYPRPNFANLRKAKRGDDLPPAYEQISD